MKLEAVDMKLIELSKKLLSAFMEQAAKSQHLRSKSNGLISHSKKLLDKPHPPRNKPEVIKKPEEKKDANHQD